MTGRVLLLGTSHPSAPIELRDRLAVAADGLTEGPPDGAGELVVLSTCNRLELYAAVDDVDAARSQLLGELARRAGIKPGALAEELTCAVDRDAVLHVCRVASGLESPMLGEPEIQGQVRAAAATAGPLLRRLFGCAIRAGRRVRSETGLAERPGSLAALAADVAARELGDLAGRRVLVVGAGTMAGLAAHGFHSRGCELVVAGRTPERTARVAALVGGRAAPLDALTAELAQADVVVSCTRSPRLVVTAEAAAGAGRPLLAIDLALPRDVDPAVAALPGCRLYDLDALYRSAGTAHDRPRADLEAAGAIAAEEAARFCAWLSSREAVAAIASLRGRAEAIRTSELVRAGGKLGGLSPAQRHVVEMLTAQIVNKLLHEPTVRVKQAAGEELVPALLELFALEDAA